MSSTRGKDVGVNGNLVTAEVDRAVMQNEVVYVTTGPLRLKAELIRVRGRFVEMQVFEDTTGLRAGDDIEFTSTMLSAELGPGLLGRVYDGLQNPLPELAAQTGFFLQRGTYLPSLDRTKQWRFTPKAVVGSSLIAGDLIGTVPEGIFAHRVMVPFGHPAALTVQWVAPSGDYTVEEVVARLVDLNGGVHEVCMMQRWPVKLPIRAYQERVRPKDPLVTQVRIVDTFFPVARGGTYCVPGPFGAGKTVLQQITSRNADVDIVIVAACGERAGEVVETLREFPELIDPRTGKSLMERTMIVCNTSSMPVAARQSAVPIPPPTSSMRRCSTISAATRCSRDRRSTPTCCDSTSHTQAALAATRSTRSRPWSTKTRWPPCRWRRNSCPWRRPAMPAR